MSIKWFVFDSNNGGTDGRGRFVNEISVRRFEFKASYEHRGDVPYHGVAALGPLNERTSGSSGMEAGAKVQLGTQFSDSGGVFVLPETDFSAQSVVLVGLFKCKTQFTKLPLIFTFRLFLSKRDSSLS